MSTVAVPKIRAGLLVVVLASVAFSSSPAAAAPEARFALLIGNNDYEHAPKLRNAVNDATDLGAVLKELGFSVQVVTNADHRTMEQSIDRFVT